MKRKILPQNRRHPTATRKKEPKDVFARFSSDWGGDMSTEDYADMLRSENVEDARTVETW